MAALATANETLLALRRQVARIEGRSFERLELPGDAARPGPKAALVAPTGVERLDAALGGGLPRSGLIELHATAARDAGTVAGLALALSRLTAPGADSAHPLLWVCHATMLREGGRLYAPGIAGQFGLAPDGLMIAQAERIVDALWIGEEAAAAGIFSAVVVELHDLPGALALKATRRLHRRALVAGHPLILVLDAGLPQPTAAPLRLRVAAARASPRRVFDIPLDGSIGPPVFDVTLDKSRAGRPVTFTLEWTDARFRERSAPYPGALVSLSSHRADMPAAYGGGAARRA